MKKMKALLAGALAGTMILTMTACDEEGAPATTDVNGTLPSTTTAGTTTTQQTFETDPAVQAVVGNVEELLDPTITVTKKIKYLSWFDFDETTATFELFKKVYGTPAEGGSETEVEQVVEFLNVAYGTRYEKLATLIQAGDSPDIFPFEICNFPYGAVKKMFQPIDDVFDLSSDLWKDSMVVMEQFKWNGKNYVPVYGIKANDLLWYRQSVIDELGAADPRELYDSGEWTWDSFLDLCYAFQESGENKYCLDGFNPENQVMGTTGVPIISLSDGKLVNNLYDSNVERAAELLTKLCNQDLRYPRHILNNYNINYGAWAKGDTLFFDDGDWRFEEHWYKYRDKNSWAADECKFVPWPRDPQSDAYYQIPQIEANMFCYGSENAEGFKALTECLLASSKDAEVIAASKQQRIDKYGWTEENLDFLAELYNIKGESPLTYIFDFKNGIGEDIASTSSQDNEIESLTKNIYVQGEDTFTQLREQNNPVIQQRIDDLNAQITA